MSNEKITPVVVTPTKSIGIGILLSFLFGPIGMFYATITGGIIMLFVSIGIGIITMGLGYFFVVPICVIWTAISVILYNKKLLSQPASHS